MFKIKVPELEVVSPTCFHASRRNFQFEPTLHFELFSTTFPQVLVTETPNFNRWNFATRQDIATKLQVRALWSPLLQTKHPSRLNFKVRKTNLRILRPRWSKVATQDLLAFLKIQIQTYICQICANFQGKMPLLTVDTIPSFPLKIPQQFCISLREVEIWIETKNSENKMFKVNSPEGERITTCSQRYGMPPTPPRYAHSIFQNSDILRFCLHFMTKNKHHSLEMGLPITSCL